MITKESHKIAERIKSAKLYTKEGPKISKGKNLAYKTRNIIPELNSTSGYCIEISDLHCEHRPRNQIKLSTGISSYQCSFFPQEKHCERPVIVFPLLKRRITTLTKLPKIKPKTHANTEKIILILYAKNNPYV